MQSASRAPVLSHCTFSSLFFPFSVRPCIDLAPVPVNSINGTFTYCHNMQLTRKLIFMISYWPISLFLPLFNDKITWLTLDSLKKIAPLKNSVHCRKTGEESCLQWPQKVKSLAFAPSIFLSAGRQLANGKIIPHQLPLRDRAPRENRGRPSPEAGVAESSFRPSQEPQKTD